MKLLHIATMLGLAALTCSCDGNDEPVVNPPQYRISWIYSDAAYQVFEYDNAGRIAEWNFKGGANMSVESTFDYQEDSKSIKIKSEEKLTDKDVWTFDEILYLNPDGTASRAEGTVILSTDGSRMTKNYTADFKYNSSRQLTKINTSEAVVNDYGQTDKPLDWAVELDWKDNNLVKYTEYSNPDYPMTIREYEYFGGQTADFLPIVQGCIFRRYYLPLQYQGVLGTNSVSMVKTMEVVSNNSDITTDYSYKMSSSIYSSFVEEYTELRNGCESVYTVGWDSKAKTVGN